MCPFGANLYQKLAIYHKLAIFWLTRGCKSTFLKPQRWNLPWRWGSGISL